MIVLITAFEYLLISQGEPHVPARPEARQRDDHIALKSGAEKVRIYFCSKYLCFSENHVSHHQDPGQADGDLPQL